MNDNTAMRDGIEAALNAMYEMLTVAVTDVSVALEHIDKNEQNVAIGGIMPTKEALEQALTLYHAIIAMHRFRN
ncbi:MAG: hypothetical protein ACREJD_08385 [Phycisphaerales bacterium]